MTTFGFVLLFLLFVGPLLAIFFMWGVYYERTKVKLRRRSMHVMGTGLSAVSDTADAHMAPCIAGSPKEHD